MSTLACRGNVVEVGYVFWFRNGHTSGFDRYTCPGVDSRCDVAAKN